MQFIELLTALLLAPLLVVHLQQLSKRYGPTTLLIELAREMEAAL